jgi:hypothetical protein
MPAPPSISDLGDPTLARNGDRVVLATKGTVTSANSKRAERTEMSFINAASSKRTVSPCSSQQLVVQNSSGGFATSGGSIDSPWVPDSFRSFRNYRVRALIHAGKPDRDLLATVVLR